MRMCMAATQYLCMEDPEESGEAGAGRGVLIKGVAHKGHVPSRDVQVLDEAVHDSAAVYVGRHPLFVRVRAGWRDAYARGKAQKTAPAKQQDGPSSCAVGRGAKTMKSSTG